MYDFSEYKIDGLKELLKIYDRIEELGMGGQDPDLIYAIWAEIESKTKRRAHEIIDLVENRIRKTWPEVEKLASAQEGNTLLHGVVYYELENEVTEALMEEE